MIFSILPFSEPLICYSGALPVTGGFDRRFTSLPDLRALAECFPLRWCRNLKKHAAKWSNCSHLIVKDKPKVSRHKKVFIQPEMLLVWLLTYVVLFYLTDNPLTPSGTCGNSPFLSVLVFFLLKCFFLLFSLHCYLFYPVLSCLIYSNCHGTM